MLIVLAVWQGLSYAVGPRLLPGPWQLLRIVVRIIHSSPSLVYLNLGDQGLWPYLLFTSAAAMIGTLTGTFAGLGLGLAFGWSARVRAVLELPIEVLRTVPPLAAVPLVLMWLRRGIHSTVAMVAFFALVRMVIYTVDALRNVHPVYAHFASTLGASKRQIYRTVMLPGILPELMGGLRVILPTAFGYEIISELVGGQKGLGRVFSGLVQMAAIGDIMAVVVWIIIVAVSVDSLVVWIGRRLTRWLPQAS